MYLRIIPGVILLVQFAVLTSCDPENVTDSKPKRGIYEFGNAGAYHVLPLQQLESFNQARVPSQAETPIVDLTYKPSEITVQQDNQHLLVYADKPKILNGQLTYTSEIAGQENKPISILSEKPRFSTNPISNVGESATQANTQYVQAFDGHRPLPSRDAIQNQSQDPTASAVQTNARYIPTYTDRPRLVQNTNPFNGQNLNQLQGFNPNNPQHVYAARQQQRAQHLNYQNALWQQQLKNVPQNLHFQNQPQQIIGPQLFLNPASQQSIHLQQQQQGQQLSYPDALRQRQLNTPQNVNFLNAVKQQQINGLQQLNFHDAANQKQIINPQQLNFQHAANQQPLNIKKPASYHYPIFHPVQAKPLTSHAGQQGQQFNNIYAGNLKTTQNIQNKPNPHRAQSQSIPQLNRPLKNPTNQQNNQYQNPQNNNLQRPPHKSQSYQSPPALLAQITENFNAIEPSFSSPQSFENAIVHQPQHPPRLPQVQKPKANNNKANNKPVQSTPTSQENTDEDTDEEDDESERSEDDESPEENTEEDTAISDEERQRRFEAGYKDAAKGFPAYNQEEKFKQFDDNDENEESDSGVEEYRPARYEDYHSDDEEDYDRDPDHDSEAYFSEQEYEKNKFYADNGVGGSQHHDKKQSQEKGRESTAHSHPTKPPSPKKLYKTDYSSKTKHPVQSNKNYKPSVQQKPPSDPRHVGTSPRKQVIKTVHPKAPVRTEAVLTAPKYEYGFEPIRSPNSQQQKGVISDSEGRHSSVHPKYVVVKQNWKISKFSETS